MSNRSLTLSNRGFVSAETPKKTVYMLEDRGHGIIMHWFHYVIAGLYELSHLPKPVFVHTKITDEYERQTFELLKPDYVFVDDVSSCILINHHGAPLIGKYEVSDPHYQFVRQAILTKNNLETQIDPTRLIYIRRSKSHLLNWANGVKRRQIVNEYAVVNALTPLGFESIFLEDYSLVEKIKIFQSSKVIVSPNGGALTMCFFANKNTHVVEITPDTTGEDMYHHVCTKLSISTTRYTNVRTFDMAGNPMVPKFLDQYSMEVHDMTDFVHVVNSIL